MMVRLKDILKKNVSCYPSIKCNCALIGIIPKENLGL